jgi:hypothetical protein
MKSSLPRTVAGRVSPGVGHHGPRHILTGSECVAWGVWMLQGAAVEPCSEHGPFPGMDGDGSATALAVPMADAPDDEAASARLAAEGSPNGAAKPAEPTLDEVRCPSHS